MSTEAREIWDAEATSFDDEPDHGLRDPETRAAWEQLLAELLPAIPHPLRVADLGCGTGSLAVLMAARGHHVHGLDVSPVMVEQARAKAQDAGLSAEGATFAVGDAAFPDLPAGAFDVVLCRHVLWALPDARAVVSRWTDLLAPGGRLVLVEGFWFTGAGLHQDQTVDLLDPRLVLRRSELLPDRALWGKEISDERFVVAADRE
ncbi:class I SAM-dependent methyltransferase [Angustibacter luteus]|uniref:Class I SAM-dependent methyltransferase n=1 Tax=Angustibacter luteus TaxID=658456 RepID=A0ABW1JDG8_9ACTN